MKKLLALLLACLLLGVTACGTAGDGSGGPAVPTELTAEDLPESCRKWFDIAANSGPAETDSQLPFAHAGRQLCGPDPAVIPDGGRDAGGLLRRRRAAGDHHGADRMER